MRPAPRQALRRPDLQRLGERVLHRVLGQLEIPDAADQAGQQARPFGAADAVDDRRQHGIGESAAKEAPAPLRA